MLFSHRPRCPLGVSLVLAAAIGCAAGSNDDEQPPDPATFVPVSGVVTLNGKPLAGAVLTFMPPRWNVGVGETDREGKYSLANTGHPGVAPGVYRVAISYLLSAEGAPQGVRARSSIPLGPAMLSAKEMLPKKYSDLSRTELTAEVNAAGANAFNFDLKHDLPEPEPKPAASTEAAEPKPEAARPAAEPPSEHPKAEAGKP